ncbi:MAG: pyridoxal-phosphate dependent enzyme [Armatimonadetes bacterium]|nr:pyridoxal-phosphate dependent enzyme [Armatimonadota bacterium]
MDQLGVAAIRAAAADLPEWVLRTPVLPGPLAGTFLKCENLQTTGSYKIRASYHVLSRLTPAQRRAGAAISSSGNFAAAFACAGAALGIKTTVVMMEKTRPNKIGRTRKLGAEVVLCENRFEARRSTLERLGREQGLAVIDHLEHPGVVLGHGTVGLEFLEQRPDLGSILVPVSTAGLLAGVALAARALRPGIQVIGVQPAGANAAVLSFQARKLLSIPKVDTVCDALTAPHPGSLPFEVMSRQVDAMVEVEDGAVLEAVRLLALESHLVVEPGGAVGLAAALSKTFPAPVGILLSGGNIEPELLARVIATAAGAAG